MDAVDSPETVSCGPDVEMANTIEPVQDGRIYIEKINAPFLYQDRGTPAEYSRGLLAAGS